MYYGQYGIDKVIEDNYLEYFDKDGWMVECGAADGIRDSVCLHFEQEYGYKVINIEAVFSLYQSLCQNRHKSITMFGALSSKKGQVNFIRATKPNEISGGSVSYKKGFDDYLRKSGYTLTEVGTPSFTYDSIYVFEDTPVVNLFVLDVEGHELDVIQGMNTCLPKVICAEYTLCGLSELKRDLGAKGYRFDFVSENNALFSIEIPEKDWIGKTDLWL
jgi:FkbM family methyltransferase